MDTNTSSRFAPGGWLGRLADVLGEAAAEDPSALPDALVCEQVLRLRRLLDQAEAQWLRRLATVDANGAAGAEDGVCAPSTAGWLRARGRVGGGLAKQQVRVARALHRGPLARTAAALAAGEVSYQHAAVLADGTRDLPAATVAEAEPVLVDAARRLGPPTLKRLATHLRDVIDPDRADERARARFERRGLWLASGHDGMLGVQGLLDAEAGEAVQAALAPLALLTGPDDHRSAAQRRADALAELANRALQHGELPTSGGARPQLLVTMELADLLAADGGQDEHGGRGTGGVGAWGGVIDPGAARRLACDAIVTRAILRRHPQHGPEPGDVPGDGGEMDRQGGGLATRVRHALTRLPVHLGGAPAELLDLGRAVRVIPTPLRHALVLRDGACVAEGCDIPAAWCEGHHLWHWLDGGPTSLANAALVCRAHHGDTHEGLLRPQRDPVTGQITLVAAARHRHPPPRA